LEFGDGGWGWGAWRLDFERTGGVIAGVLEGVYVGGVFPVELETAFF
jgi:hypothetical protein